MAIEFNLLSGATIDNQLRMLYELLRGGDSYLGFGRGHETWGQGTLIRYTAATGQIWPNDIIGETVGAEIYDDLHRLMNISTEGTTAVHVARFDYADGEADFPVDNDDRMTYLTGSGNGIVNGMANLECIFINNKWITIRGIDPTYEFKLYDDTEQRKYKYFIMNFAKDIGNLLEIDIVREFEYPGLSTRVQLKYGEIGSLDATIADIVPGCSDLERRINLNGEYLVTGIGQEFITWIEDPISGAKNQSFFLVDVDGALLVDGVQYEETVITPQETAYVFSYQISESSPSGPVPTRKVRFKLSTLSNINNKFAVFKESLPIRSHVSPVADNNPPGLPISYIRSQDIHESMLDIVGLHQLDQNDVWLAYEIPEPFNSTNDIWQYFTDKVLELDDANMLSIDAVKIDEDIFTGQSIEKQYAISKDLSFGMTEGFNLVMVSLELDNVTPTTDIYRQLFISWKPKYYDTGGAPPVNSLVDCGTGHIQGPDYMNRTTFFDPDEHVVDMGTLFYLANKMPIYRNYIDGNEQFKIIL